ncbi:MAG: hypothetical protein HRU03_06150 [Nanoarchaeales archaeon]|nr:hypothetical protein [Nanoarchaeales archaeon]
MDRRREIYIKIDELSELVKIMKTIKSKENQVRHLFDQYDSLNIEEHNLFENWSNYFEDTFTRMDNLRL